MFRTRIHFRLAALSWASAIALGLSLVALNRAESHPADELPSSHSARSADELGVVLQSPEEALAQDLALIAEARAWSLSEADAYYEREQAIGRIAELVAAERPEIFVGSVLSDDPAGAPVLLIKGPADDFVHELVRGAGIEIVVADNQPFSFAELEERKVRVHHTLQQNGFVSLVTAVNITGGGVIKVSLTPDPRLPATAEAILRLLPEDLRSSVELTIHDVPLVVPEGAFGGMWMADDGVRWCTSGWTVQAIGSPTRGVSTASHCPNGTNQIEHPGHGIHSTVRQIPAHEGQWGDVEWHTTTQFEADDFYADAATLRDVVAVEPRAGIAQNEAICAYGRSSNQRDCSLEVLDVSIACGVLDRLVQMNGDTQVGGDSGGGWWMNHTAFGGHFGNCGGLDSFSVADLFDEAIGVFVATTN